jgi:phosphatidate cytidylyltransferase
MCYGLILIEMFFWKPFTILAGENAGLAQSSKVGGNMLKQRIVTAIVGVLLVFGAIESGSVLPWHLVVWVATLLAMTEFSSMFGFTWRSQINIGGLIIVSVADWAPKLQMQVVLYILLCAILLYPVITKNRVTVTQAAVVAVGAGYIGYGGACMIGLRQLNHGVMWVWLCLICIWLTDTAAFFVGRTFGGPKLWPEISPKKTISGALGGIVAAALGALIFGYTAVPNFDPTAYLVTGAVISVAGQLGDLVESAYKRSTGVKDSGKLLPGHGGMLDRIDSLLFAAPFAFYLITTGAAGWFQ